MKKLSTLFGLMFLVISFAYSQRTITGTITDGNDPLIGATVKVQGESMGTITDIDGKFTLSVPDGTTEIVVSYTGFETQTVNIAGRSDIDVVLSEGILIDEVVVMGYYSAKREQLTGSAVQLEKEKIEQIPVSSVDRILQGKVAGLTFAGESGTPGASGNIRIRGISSITTGNEPLYVVDGVPVANYNYGTGASSTFTSLSSMNPNDIESVTVLKDASAIAAYGARGTNGVIVITTKSGKRGKTKFNLNSSYGVSNDAWDGPQVLTADQQVELLGDAIFNTYGESEGFTREEAIDFGRENLYNTNAEIYDWIDAGKPVHDWAKEITNVNAPRYDVNLSASGGGEQFDFYATLGYLDQEATVVGGAYKRYNAGLRLTYDVAERIKFSTNNTYSNGLQDALLEQSAYFSSPRAAKFFTSPANAPRLEDGTYNFGFNFNPLHVAENDIDNSIISRISTNNALTWDIPIEGLKFTTRYTIDQTSGDLKQYRNRIHGDGASVEGSAFRRWRRFTNSVFQNNLTYNWQLGGDHNFSFQAIQEYQQEHLHYLSAYAEGFSTDGLTNLDQAGSPQSTNSSFDDWYVASYTGLLNYNFGNRFVFNATLRREGNSRFDRENRWGNFYAVGAGWNIHEEAFIRDGSLGNVFHFLKLRGSLGTTGNSNIGLNRYQATLGYNADYGGQAAIYPANFGTKDLTWEKANNYEVGVDFGLMNRITGSFSYYLRQTYEMLLDDPLPLSSGFTSQTRNLGEMDNSGIEIELSADIVKTRDFTFTIGGNLGTNKNEVTGMPLLDEESGDLKTITGRFTRVEVGHTVNEWYIRKFAGVDPQTGLNTWYINGVDGETTDNYNDAEKGWQGTSALPTKTAGVFLDLKFKNVSLSASGYYAGGHQVYESWTRYTNGTDLWPLWFNGVTELMDRWQQPGDVTRISRFEFGTKPWRDFSKYLYDGDYFRVKDVTLGYDFNGAALQNMGIGNAKIFVRGTNLFTWVKDPNMKYDPEVPIHGFTELTTPPVKTILGGININF